MKILLTGGTGYIASHTAVVLLEHGHEVVLVDNLSNSKKEVVSKIEKIANKKVSFYEVDVCNKEKLTNVFKKEKVDAVIHFAGYKAVGESVKLPIKYFSNNINSTLVLLEVMEEFNVNKLVFSSSATVYGEQKIVPIKETATTGGVTNPYGRTKLMIEEILEDYFVSNEKVSFAILRYFNPVGAHESGLIGESPNGIPNNLMPYITQVACGKLKELSVFGNDYDTHDGTGVRDYIHVCDLAYGHYCALNKLIKDNGLFKYNLGTGIGYSVLDLVNTFSKINNISIPYKIVDRREGDVAKNYADVTFSKKEINFEAKHDLASMCKTSWNYQKNNL